MNEDVFPIEHGGFFQPVMLVFGGGLYIYIYIFFPEIGAGKSSTFRFQLGFLVTPEIDFFLKNPVKWRVVTVTNYLWLWLWLLLLLLLLLILESCNEIGAECPNLYLPSQKKLTKNTSSAPCQQEATKEHMPVV